MARLLALKFSGLTLVFLAIMFPVTKEEHGIIDLQDLLRNVSRSLSIYQDHLSNLKISLELPACIGKLTKARDCADYYLAGNRTSGVYRVRPTDWPMDEGFDVFCDMDTDDGGWTVFQRRGNFGNSETYFFRNWVDYKRGFGDLNKEYWIGNDRLSALTSQRSYMLGPAYQLRIDMMDADNKTAYASYEQFLIQDAGYLYRLYVDGYTGTAGDSLLKHNNMNFSTKDVDNDLWSKNCAAERKGGWWFNACYDSNLNGLNTKGLTKIHHQGIIWSHWRSTNNSLLFTEMKIRPREFAVRVQ